jgi:thioredoxin reductase (NADPH)
MQPEITIYGVDSSPETLHARSHLDRRRIAYRYVNLDKDEHAQRKVMEWNRGERITPTIVVSGNGRTRRLAAPSDEELDAIISEQAA